MRAVLILVMTLFALLVGAVPAASGADVYSWPLTPRPAVVNGFDPPAQRWLPGHRGVDLAGAEGVAVLAAGTGTVHFAGPVAGRGVVSIRHADGLLTTYEPVVASVSRGAPVSRGAVIGTLQAGHDSCPSTCLHWGARRGSGRTAVYLDPLALLGGVRVVLKPLDRAGA